MEYSKYNNYKDTKINWLGKLPSSWKLSPLKFLTKCLDNRRIPLNSEERAKMSGNYPYYGANGIVDHVDDYIFDEPLVLLGEDGAPFNEFGEDVAFFINRKCWVNNHAHILRAVNIDAKYLTYTLNTVNYSVYISGSTRDKLTQGDMKRIKIPVPIKSEQDKIVRFLDQETSRIDKLIEKKENLIDLLEEKRQAVITHHVTKGLNPNVPMKDSGIDWLGEIPEHWEIVKLKYLIDEMQTGSTPPTSNEEYFNGNLNWFTPEDFNKGHYIDDSKRKLTRKAIEDNKAPILDAQTIAFVGIGATIGKVALLKKRSSFNQQITGIKTNTKLLPEILYYWLLSINDYIKDYANFTTLPIINNEELKSLICIVPPLKEQRKIINRVKRNNKKIDQLVKKIKEQISNLKEYRQALITNAVTGKIDVRDLV